MLAKSLMMVSSGIILGLGVIHLIYTFSGTNLLPRDPSLQVLMSQVHPGLTTETTMWKTWIGFNASHSMGAILFGLIFGFLAYQHTELLFNSAYLLAVGFLMLAGLFVLGKLYWFSVPFACITISLVCYLASIAAARA